MSDPQTSTAAAVTTWAPLPWLVAPLQRAMQSRSAHALLVHGPAGVGQFDLALALAEGWLCESTTRAAGEWPCGVCAACRLLRARSHPDLLVLVPEADRETLGWTAGSADGGDGGSDKEARRKPSKEIRIEAIREAIVFASTTSARGRGKIVVIHPAERMNGVSANAFLKTLEEPPGAARFVLGSMAPDALLPTIRSRCQSIAIAIPPIGLARSWLAEHGVSEPDVLLAACGGQPQEALAWSRQGVDAATWKALPRRVSEGDVGALRGWPLPMAIDALQKLCHDALAVACGAPPRYFDASLRSDGSRVVPLLAWSRELARIARHVEHPWNVELTVESLVEQGREALNTPRSTGRLHGADSLHLRR